MRRFLCLLLLVMGWQLGLPPARAQNGDRQGENQAPPPSHWVIPPSPPSEVSESLKSFRIQPGFQIEIVASEPLIEAPVEIEFGPDGRLWVVEMRGFMPDVDGRGEDAPNGQITVLEDTDHDGRMDKRTVFLDGLVLPRALALVADGVLVAEPPNLWFCRDTNADGVCDQKTLVTSDYGSQANPEHCANGLLMAMDNWVYSANHTNRIRFLNGSWVQAPTQFRGQWGLTLDDWGRLFHNSNSDQLRGDLVWADYFLRHPELKTGFGYNYPVAKDQSVWSGRVNPGVNRGYQKGQLREDGRLATFTGACGPCIYRGDQFPAAFRGAAFLCEPTANIVRCNFLREKDGVLTATNAFPGGEFLTSTDERFRPVNLANGPDGNLYIVDMARGVIQHRIFLTTYLRQQALDRQLAAPLNQGRIYRVTRAGATAARHESLAGMPPEQLARKLASSNGWTRDTAQRLLVERRDFSAVPAVRRLVTQHAGLAGLHALWTLDGLGALDDATLRKGLKDRDPRLRSAALRLSETRLASPATAGWLDELTSVLRNSTEPDRTQLALSLGGLTTNAAPGLIRQRDEIWRSLLRLHPHSPFFPDAVLSGLAGHELVFLEDWMRTSNPNDALASATDLAVTKSLARLAALRTHPQEVGTLLAWAGEYPASAPALLGGILAIQPPTKATNARPARLVKFAQEPLAWAGLKALTNLATLTSNLDRMLQWPGKLGMASDKRMELTAEEKKLFADGKVLYLTTCGSCHQPHGMGQDGLAPPLADSDWVTGPPQRLIRIALHGMRGPVTVKGKVYELEMPPLGVLEDEQIASLLTYVRNEWSHAESAVTPAQVAKIRDETKDREEAWKAADLEKIP